ncbi:acyloxyacyl hydrolase [Desulfosediminicola flagellatus]|uniref:acyloxyacyl hydrolase n=1 Tax=Desulfosediminicola flagellatus TaxID=2569541 RepID=UPI0010AB6DB7|nr:acyloxyacyl hydrolase [Desulfosediminicola flagellatus]
MRHRIFFLVAFFLLFGSTTIYGQVPTRYGGGLTGGNSYDPSSEITWVQGTAFALFDYETVWHHRAPDPLRFKVEAHAGVTVQPETRIITSANILALYYLDGLVTGSWRIYMEAGIGIIYTDFMVEGQGLRINFNPQAGMGVEYSTSNDITWFAGLRAHHISNGGLDDDNRGINSVTFILGRYW